MPKMKTRSGAKKRYKVTGTGKLTRRKANLNHILEKKSSRRKRALTGDRFGLSGRATGCAADGIGKLRRVRRCKRDHRHIGAARHAPCR